MTCKWEIYSNDFANDILQYLSKIALIYCYIIWHFTINILHPYIIRLSIKILVQIETRLRGKYFDNKIRHRITLFFCFTWHIIKDITSTTSYQTTIIRKHII